MRIAADHPYVVMRPFFWVAAASFATGFFGYAAIFG